MSGERPRFRRWMEQLYTGVGAGDLPAATLAVVLGTIMLVAGALELPVVVFFPLPGVSKALPLTIVLVAMTYALGLIVVAHRLRARFPYWALHASMLGAVVLIALGTWSAQGEAVAIIGLNLYFWGVLYVFGFFRWQIGVCYLALSVVLGCAILSFTVIQDPVTVELIFATSAVVGAVVVGHERVALRRLAFVDVLTGLPNRAAFAGLLRRAVSTASERSAPLSVAVIDLDNLKAANDSLGHEAGDVILQRFVTEWDAMLRADDILVRYGGDEFIALLPGCDLADAERVLRRIHVLSEYECSIGVAQWRPVDTSEELLARADAALYRAKQQGRNQVVVG